MTLFGHSTAVHSMIPRSVVNVLRPGAEAPTAYLKTRFVARKETSESCEFRTESVLRMPEVSTSTTSSRDAIYDCSSAVHKLLSPPGCQPVGVV